MTDRDRLLLALLIMLVALGLILFVAWELDAIEWITSGW